MPSRGAGHGRGSSQQNGGSRIPFGSGHTDKPAFRGRGRAPLTDMTAMSLDYDRQVNSKADPVMPLYGSHSNGSTRPHTPSIARIPQPSNTSSPSKPRPSPSYANPAPRLHAGLGAARLGTPQSYPSSNISGQSPITRRPEYIGHDPNLIKPVAFVKASSGGLSSTMQADELEQQRAQQRLKELFASASLAPRLLTPAMAESIVMPPPQEATTSGTNGPVSSAPMSQTSSNQSASSGSRALSAAAKPFDKPSFLAATGFLNTLASAIPSTSAKKISEVAKKEEKGLFVVDVNGAKANTRLADSDDRAMLDNDDVDAESGTEDLFPRRPIRDVPSPIKSQQSGLGTTLDKGKGKSANTDKPPDHLPVTNYARVIDDDVDITTIFRPYQQTLSPAAPIFAPTSPPRAVAIAETDVQKSKKLSKNAQLQLKREAKRNRKRAKRNGVSQPSNKERKQARVDDSDIEWGSDGPPANADNDEEGDSEVSNVISRIAASGVAESSVSSSKVPNGKMARGKKKTAIDLAVEDYLANIAAQNASSTSDDEASGAPSKAKKIDVDDLARLRSFANAVSAGEHLSINDLQDLAASRRQDDEDDITSDQSTDDSDSDIGNEEAYEERLILREAKTEENGRRERFPVFVPAVASWKSDEEDERNAIFRSDIEDMNEADLIEAGKRFLEAFHSGDDVASEGDDDQQHDPSGKVNDDEDTDSSEVADVISSSKQEKVMIVVGDEEDDQLEDSNLIDDSDSEEEGLEDEADEEADLEELLMSKPARRARQAPDFKDDIFGEQLQAQWRRDREKKAARRQERALKRLEQKPSRANAKKAKRASAKRKGFRSGDVSDEEASLKTASAVAPDFHRLNEELKKWINESGFAEYQLPPMDKKFRMAVHMLAGAYNLKSKSRGTGRDRHNVLYRTQTTSVSRADGRKVNQYLAITSSWSNGGGSKSVAFSRTSRSGGGGGGPVSRNHEGAVVGEGADRIAADNIGHQMLAKMGWTQGMQIGRSGGINEPIHAIVKTSRAGLGSGWIRYNKGQMDTNTYSALLT